MAVSQLAVNVALTGTSDSLIVLRIMTGSPPEPLPEAMLFFHHMMSGPGGSEIPRMFSPRKLF